MNITRGLLLTTLLLAVLCLSVPGAYAEAILLDPNERAEIRIVGSLRNFEGMEAVIAEFEEEYRNCTVTYEYVDDYANAVVSLLENDAADTQLFLSYADVFAPDDIRTQVSVDYADPRNGVDISDVNTAVTATKYIGGKLYTVPLALNPRGMMVNVDLLAAYGLALPKTYDEFMNACEVLKNNGLIPIQGFQRDFAINLTTAYAMGSIAKRDDADAAFAALDGWEAGSGAYFTGVFDVIDTVMQNGYASFEENAKQKDGYESAILNFFEGDAAFFPCTSETFSGTRKRESKSARFTEHPFEYVFSAVPLDETGGYVYRQAWQGISVNKTADNEEWGRAFVEFLFEEENMALLADVKGMVPNTNAPGSDERYRPLYDVPEANTVVADKVSPQVLSALQTVLQGMCLSPDSPDRLDKDGALAAYEALIATKR